jgi:integrase
MRGSIKKRGSTYTYVVDIGPDPLTGKRRQRTKGGFRTRKECLQARNAVIAAARAGTFVEPAKRTLESFLVEEWLPAVKPPRVRESTWLSYQLNIQNHIVPNLGTHEPPGAHPRAAHRLLPTPAHQRPPRRQGRPRAQDREEHPRHPAPGARRRDALGLCRPQRRRCGGPAEGQRPRDASLEPGAAPRVPCPRARRPVFAAWMLFATTGMRRGEVAGLRWTDVDLQAGQVKVAKPRVAVRYKVHVSEPKTLKGKRWLALDPATAAALREHRTRQAEERLMVGPGWVESGLVFTWPDGRALHPERFTRWFQQHAHDAGLPKIRLHDVRHSYATAALAAGVPAKLVSERLGHANIAITMDTYSHVLPGMDERAASAVARLILGDEAAPGEGAVNNL